MRLYVRPEAALDIYEAALWYDGENVGLGNDFLQKIRKTLHRIEESPLQFPVVSSDIRRAILQKFPFGIFFVIEDQVCGRAGGDLHAAAQQPIGADGRLRARSSMG